MSTSQTQSQSLSDLQQFWVLLGIGMGVFMSTLDVGIINVTLPTLCNHSKPLFLKHNGLY
ncbi:hypothetical protein B6N60_02392 [Richelia sinica FACHB-800]|uniref:Uncharacterized protein n=1 Tax=Richelia sinica FACHB-800 TaxID=1357546 RepID=A0A975T921_9NOST|nr:hypothetical protein [Richelia sinica]QXE23702.1 hypothetical protein B6N60_02392 [Richelia sinica FACHB-800]